MVPDWRITCIVASSVAGAVVKLVGGLLYCSKALLVDALTCVANIVSLTATLYYYSRSVKPPDSDHPFGHHRLGLVGVIVTLMAYSFVAGLVVRDLIGTTAYKVGIEAPVFASVGFALYALTVILSRSMGTSFRVYGVFTVSELIESSVVIIASLLGSLYSYLIDLGGALILTAYLVVGLCSTLRELSVLISDTSPHPRVLEKVRRIVESQGAKLGMARLRIVEKNRFQGDITVLIDPDISVEQATRIASNIEEELRRIGIDAIVRVKAAPENTGEQ